MQSSTKNAKNITIWLSALMVEIAPILALLDEAKPVSIGKQLCWHGHLKGYQLYLVVSGAGRELCEQALIALLNRLPNARVLIVGMAGATNPILQIGDVIVANRSTSWSWQEKKGLEKRLVRGAIVDHDLREKVSKGSDIPFSIVPGHIITLDELVCDPHLKALLYSDYKADCVDMETGYAAWICTTKGVPFMAIRGISDRADSDIGKFGSKDFAVAVWHSTIAAVKFLHLLI